LRPFRPIIANTHFLTTAGNFWPRKLDVERFPVESRLFRTEPDVQVRVDSQRPQGEPRGQIVLVHGLEGSGESGYMRSLSQAGLEAGFVMRRFHMRTCGGTTHLCRTLYHAGLTSDLLSVLRQLGQQDRAPVYLAGFSLGGNVVLKLTGELGDEADGLIAGVCALCTPIDLAACVRRMGKLDNRLYERRFVRRMCERMISTGRYTQADFRGMRSLYDIDDKITAPAFGFHGADHYYATQSSNQFLDRIRVPTMVLQAQDDTFIPFEIFRHPAFQSNPFLTLVTPRHGGHLGFLSRVKPRFWLDEVILEWVEKGLERQQSGVGSEKCAGP